jgi:hypothetical protein
MNDLLKLLNQLEASRFFGSVEVKFEAGQITVIKKTENIKPATNNHRENRGNANDRMQ